MASAPMASAPTRAPGRPRLRREECVVPLCLTVQPGIRDWVEQEADRLGCTMSRVVTLALQAQAQAAQAG